MKKFAFYLFSLLIFAACQPDSGNGQSNQAALTPGTTSPSDAPNNTNNREPVHVPASTLAPMIGLWHYEATAGLKDAATRDLYEGRWIDLKGDQSFTSGKWQEQTNSGKWEYNAESKQINFFYQKNEGIYDEFIVQGAGGEIVVFKGNTERTTRGIQIKMVKYPDRPTQ